MTDPILFSTLARTVIVPRELPVGVLTALIGVPLMLLVVAQAVKHRPYAVSVQLAGACCKRRAPYLKH